MARDIYEDHDELTAEAPKDGLANGLIILTTVVLLVSTFLMQKALADHFGAGMLADKPAQGGAP